MSTTTPELKTSRNSDKYVSNWKLIAVPYAVAILAQLPMLFLYFRNLYIEKPHYQTAPFAFLATLAIAYFRWPKEAKMPFHRSVLSDLLLGLGLLFAFVCVLFAWPSAGAGSVMLLVASLLARTVDKETLKSLWPAALPMFVYLTLPSGYDIQLITWLQRVSAYCTSRLLDLYGLGHYMDGTVIQVPGREPYGIEAACSGVQSFFTLLFIAVLFVVVYRRPFFRSALLIASAVFWALFMNTVRIFLIPVLDQFDIDVVHGFPHAVLGWGTLAVGVILLLSTDQFMTFMFGPVDPEVGRTGPFGKLITKAWNGLISGEQAEDEKKKRKKKVRKPITNAGKFAIWGLCGVLALAGIWSSFDVAYSFATAPDYIRFFDSDVIRSFEENDLPTKIDQWTAIENGHSIDIRDRGSDLGRRSDKWQFKGSQFATTISMDQPFPGWHELTTCYKNGGWELVNRVRMDATNPGVDPSASQQWPYVIAEFKRETGERGYLVFAMFNSVGEPVTPPATWNRMVHFFSGVSNRMSNRVRASLFDNSTYQIQAFTAFYGNGLETAAKKEIESHFLKIRETLREKFVARTGNAAGPSVPADAAN